MNRKNNQTDTHSINKQTDNQNFDNEPKTWPELIWRMPVARNTVVFITIVVSLQILLGIPLISYYLYSNTNLLKYTLQQLQVNPAPSPDFATFKKQGEIVTDEGNPFNITSDYMFGGNSTIHPRIAKHENKNDYYIQSDFKLNRGISKITNSYVCLYSEWTPPPFKFVDISKYDGITFQSRLKLTDGNFEPKLDNDDNSLQLIISIATDGILDYAYHEYNYSIDQQGLNMFQEVKVQFSKLGKPPWHIGPIPPFNPKAVYRITITIKGNDQAGTLDIDDLKLYNETAINQIK